MESIRGKSSVRVLPICVPLKVKAPDEKFEETTVEKYVEQLRGGVAPDKVRKRIHSMFFHAYHAQTDGPKKFKSERASMLTATAMERYDKAVGAAGL